jgi:hypothetical protein
MDYSVRQGKTTWSNEISYVIVRQVYGADLKSRSVEVTRKLYLQLPLTLSCWRSPCNNGARRCRLLGQLSLALDHTCKTCRRKVWNMRLVRQLVVSKHCHIVTSPMPRERDALKSKMHIAFSLAAMHIASARGSHMASLGASRRSPHRPSAHVVHIG